ncbi:MAG: hypothetical protein K2Q21_08600, partial [Chitinophagaceae bacterium]|nr:hypothetical protein [Chitinophagaceae bacterium]
MKRKFLITLFTIFSQCVIIYGQNSLAFPSANNTFLGATGNISSATGVNVDLYTGTAMINTPICNLASKEISIPISLSYIGARGIRVQDNAGSVGLGWQLNAGGSISRVVRCFPDEQSNGYLGTGQWGKVIANNLANNIAMSSSQSDALFGVAGGPPTADGEPDIFYIKTPSFSVQFTFDENGNPVFSNSTGIKIISNYFYNNPSYTNSSFEVIDNSGNQYYFGSSPSSVETSTTLLYGTSYTFPTTWYLDKIITYNAKDQVTFSYANYFPTDINNHYQYSMTYDNFGNTNPDNTPISITVNSPKVISKIISSLGELDFNYATDRRDDINAVRISSISLNSYNTQIQTNSILLKTFYFNYSYFGDPATDPNLLRLRLDKITVVGNTTETSAPLTINTFGYNTNVNLPSRQQLWAVDFFGYYTFSTAANPYNVSLPPNFSYAQANILNSITDVTGVNNQITYELNSYYNKTSLNNVDVGGLRVSQISKILPTGENLYSQYKYVDNNNNSSGEILSSSYLINKFSSCGMNKTLSESPSNYYDLNGNYVGYSSVKVLNQNGGYTIFSFSNFSTPNCNDILKYSSASGIPDITSSISAAYKRGLLLDQANYNSVGQIISEDITPLASYVSLTTNKSSWAYHWYNVALAVAGGSCSFSAASTYWTNIENYRPTQTIHKDYAQNNPSSYV